MSDEQHPIPEPSPDKGPAHAEAGRPYLTTEKPGKHRGDPTLWDNFKKEFYADNTFTVTLFAIVLALIFGGILMIIGDADTRAQWGYFFYQPLKTLEASWDLVSKAYTDMFKGAVVNPDTVNRWYWDMTTWQQVFRPISETLTNAAPLILTGLAVAIPFRAGLFNIGGQGQAIMGAIGGGTVGILLKLPAPIVILLAILAGALLGGLWGLLVGVLKAKTGAHEVIVTIMLNYIALYFLFWYIRQAAIDDPNRSELISKPVPDSSIFPKLIDPALRVNLGILLALLVAAGVAWLLKRGTFGFELRAVGYNPNAAGTAGIKVGWTLALTMGLAGALAGLGGTTMVLGTAGNLTGEVVGQIGFNGILVALLGRVKPWGVVGAGLLFGALQAGGAAMQTFSGISNELVTAIQAMIVIFVAAPLLVKAVFRLRKSPSAAASAALAKG
ncbi:ABC transporter permease [Catelliglobosispora koreensis]|uniref:ABC transporter permease n=1 Tax=Catelliglobosispora koreensis TaxID=129052 RepID=UPI000366AA35|nr:ABC transporter permease [Catelliglobosispora koreensis]